MGLLDVKEMNYAKYVLGNIFLPALAVYYFIKNLGPILESGGTKVVLLAQLGCKYS